MSEPLLKEEPAAQEVLIEAKEIVAQIRRATVHAAALERSVAEAASNLGVNMLSANEELVQAHRQLCGVLNLAEIKQRASMERLEKQTRRLLRAVMERVVLIVGTAAVIGAALGGAITVMLLR
ncbi:hypothetical protein DKY63_31030 [Pseudomonas putida]|uniref:StbC n=1 Tax=Pseudomonas putida TaxID=303 RepID=A0A2Z4RSU3_PSEPU|nr:hypothetical protein [Pseudomonas putida]AWY44106.1 hypothetical protein DKY63_31030 [Pseudomonas putida]